MIDLQVGKYWQKLLVLRSQSRVLVTLFTAVNKFQSDLQYYKEFFIMRSYTILIYIQWNFCFIVSKVELRLQNQISLLNALTQMVNFIQN